MALFRLLCIATASIASAVLSCAAAAGMVLAEPAPQLAVKSPVSNGFAQSELAASLVAQSIKKGTLLQLEWPERRARRVQEYSLAAYRREPLDAGALAFLALTDETGRAQRLMRDAEQLSRRKLIVELWLMTDYAKQRGNEAALTALDNALRTSSSARPLLMRTLVQSLTEPGFANYVVQLLADRPPWAEEFWHQAYTVPAALPNVANVRAMAARRGIPVPEQYDQALLSELAHNRLFPQAEQVRELLGGAPRAKGEAIRNADFRASPRYLPFDWQTFFDDSLTVDLVPSPGQLVIRTYEGGAGKAARQLIELSPGKYVFSAAYPAQNAKSLDALSAALTCAEADSGRVLARFRMGPGQAKQTLEVADPNCRYYWFDLEIAPQADRQPNTIVVDSISLAKIADHG
jgi:hypothetical protein